MRISDWSSDVCSSDLALGFYAQALGDNSVALGTGSVADRANAVSVGAGPNIDGFAEERQITHVAAGTEDTDAVNLAQLEEVAKTADNTDYFFKASADPDNDSVGAYVEGARSEEHQSEPQSLMRHTYPVL